MSTTCSAKISWGLIFHHIVKWSEPEEASSSWPDKISSLGKGNSRRSGKGLSWRGWMKSHFGRGRNGGQKLPFPWSWLISTVRSKLRLPGFFRRYSTDTYPFCEVGLLKRVANWNRKWLPLADPACHGTKQCFKGVLSERWMCSYSLKTPHNETVLRKFVESLSTRTGTKNNATRRSDFWARPSVPRTIGCVRCRHLECGWTHKQFHVLAGPLNFLNTWRDFSMVAWITGHMSTGTGPNKEKKEDHARLVAQVPASSVRNPGGNHRQERMDAVSGLNNGRHRADNELARHQDYNKESSHLCKWTRKKLEPTNVKASVATTWQISPLKVTRTNWHGQHALVFVTEKVQTRGKTVQVLTVSSRSLR